MISEEAVSYYLRAAPGVRCPDEVRSRLRATIAGEVKLRRASRVEPDADVRELKNPARLWANETIRRS
ncbi:MAG: hypothetical protein QM619_02270 [Micropruina sp.]|uniref:hypothetical protein n=1 Tax=Micropruina sp. TaxID=2737536 RepID=UPI0039E2BA89